jgi:hypothetical protein
MRRRADAPRPVPRGEVGELPVLILERDLELAFYEPQVQPGAAEHQLAEPVHQAFAVQGEDIVDMLEQVLAERADGKLDDPARDQLHEVGALVVAEQPGFHKAKLHRSHLHSLSEIDAVEPVAETAEFQDVVFAGGVIRVGVSVLGCHAAIVAAAAVRGCDSVVWGKAAYNDAMRQFRRHIAVVIAAAVFAGLICGTALFALGCGGSAAQVDPATVLSASAAKMKLIKGFHLVYEVHMPAGTKPGTGLEIARITGDVNADGNMQAAIDVTQGNVPLTLNFVQVGDTQYLQMGAWQKIPVENSPVGKLTLGASTVQILEQVSGAQYMGQGKKAGAKCYHINGSVPAAAVKAIAQSTTTATPFPVDIWIGVADSYIYEVDIHGPATADEPAAAWRSIVLSNHDVFVDIKAPI